MSTAISTFRLSIERSDSSASTTSHSPLPHSAFARPAPTEPPTSQPGSRPAARSACYEHRGGRRLAVRARHRDRPAQRGQLGQELGARALGDPPLARRRPLDVSRGNGRGVDDLHALARGHVLGGVADARLAAPRRPTGAPRRRWPRRLSRSPRPRARARRAHSRSSRPRRHPRSAGGAHSTARHPVRFRGLAHAAASSSSAATSRAASGRARLREAEAIASRRGRSASSASVSAPAARR